MCWLCESDCCRQLSHARRKARAGSAAEIPSAAWHDKAAAAADSLIIAFRSAPQTVMGICAQTLKKARENDSSKGAQLFLSDVLAMPSQPGPSHAGSVVEDALRSRPELRGWMVAQAEGLKRGNSPPAYSATSLREHRSLSLSLPLYSSLRCFGHAQAAWLAHIVSVAEDTPMQYPWFAGVDSCPRFGIVRETILLGLHHIADTMHLMVLKT